MYSTCIQIIFLTKHALSAFDFGTNINYCKGRSSHSSIHSNPKSSAIFQSVFLGSLNILDTLYLKTCTKIGKSIMTWNIQSCKRRETEQFKSEGKDNAIERQTDGNVNNVLQYLIYQIRKKKKKPLGLLNLYGEFFLYMYQKICMVRFLIHIFYLPMNVLELII